MGASAPIFAKEDFYSPGIFTNTHHPLNFPASHLLPEHAIRE
jgi:hypothetical protein